MINLASVKQRCMITQTLRQDQCAYPLIKTKGFLNSFCHIHYVLAINVNNLLFKFVIVAFIELLFIKTTSGLNNLGVLTNNSTFNCNY